MFFHLLKNYTKHFTELQEKNNSNLFMIKKNNGSEQIYSPLGSVHTLANLFPFRCELDYFCI